MATSEDLERALGNLVRGQIAPVTGKQRKEY